MGAEVNVEKQDRIKKTQQRNQKLLPWKEKIEGEKKNPTREFHLPMEGCKEGKWCGHQWTTLE